MKRAISLTLSGIKYVIAVFFMYAGISTALSPLDAESNPAGFIYASRASLVALGAWFFASGFVLLVAKIWYNRKLVGWALLSMYLSFLFGSILNGYSNGGEVSAWLPNLMGSFVIGALYLRWKYHILYVPKRTRRERQRIINEYLKD